MSIYDRFLPLTFPQSSLASDICISLSIVNNILTFYVKHDSILSVLNWEVDFCICCAMLGILQKPDSNRTEKISLKSCDRSIR